MQGMDAEARSELARLRARAYGPDADLPEDALAWARLQELEELDRRRRAESASPIVGQGAPRSAVDGTAADADASGVDTRSDGDADGAEEPPVRPPLVGRPRTLWLWAGSLAAVAAVSSAASIAATTFVPVPRTAGVAQVDTLRIDPAVDTTALGSWGFNAPDVVGYTDFHGITAYAGSTQVGADGARADCLLLVDTAEIPEMGEGGLSQSGFRSGGCGAGAFPATVEFVVTPTFPETFRERFPVGSSVQFVRDGERVGVFSDAG
jgi:hypothetical protein